MNPLGTVPFVIIDGDQITESAVILRTLALKYPKLNKYYPDDAEMRMLIDGEMDFNGQVLRNESMGSLYPLVFSRI